MESWVFWELQVQVRCHVSHHSHEPDLRAACNFVLALEICSHLVDLLEKSHCRRRGERCPRRNGVLVEREKSFSKIFVNDSVFPRCHIFRGPSDAEL